MSYARIYALKKPITLEVFYIGKTTKSLNGRLKQHISEANSLFASNERKKEYIKSIVSNGLLPEIELLELIEVTSEDDYKNADKREIIWVNHFLSSGCDLFNKQRTSSGKFVNALFIRVTLELKEKLQKLADKDQRYLADFIRLQLEKLVK